MQSQDTLDLFFRAIDSGPGLDGLVAGICSELKEALGVERAAVLVLLDKKVRFLDGTDGQDGRMSSDKEAMEELEAFFEIAAGADKYVVLEGKENLSAFQSLPLAREGYGSILLYPLKRDGQPVAVLLLCSRFQAFFSKEKVSLLERISNGLLTSISQSLLYEETRKRADELSILYKMTKISTSSPNLDQMLEEIVEELRQFFRFDTWGILFLDEATKKLVPHPSFVWIAEEETKGTDSFLGKGIPAWVAEKGEPLLVNYVPRTKKSLSTERILSEMCVPLKVEGRVFGIIDAKSRQPNAFSEKDFHLFKVVGEHLSIIIENARSEERYRAVVEGALDGVIVLSEDFQITYVNDRFADILGYSRQELLGLDFRWFLDERSRKAFLESKEKKAKGEYRASGLELNVIRKDRKIRCVEMSFTFIKDSQGNMSIVAFAKDITEKRRMEEQLLQAKRLRAMMEIAGGMAHDFNNALAIIIGNTQMLLESIKDEDARKTLLAIVEEARQTAYVATGLMDLTKKGIGGEIKMVDLNTVIQDAVEATRPIWKDECEKNGIRIGVNLHLETIPPVAGVASDLVEVVSHMIGNAVEAMPDGGNIEIRTFESNGVCFRISDSGVGMTEEIKQKVFEPFFTTRGPTHTGLGLSVAYGIIRRHGGRIDVESMPGQGTTFTVFLPKYSDDVFFSRSIPDRREINI